MNKAPIILLILFLAVSCTDDLQDSLDFKDIENRNLYPEDIIGVPDSSAGWLEGIEKQLSNTLNKIVLPAELTSDNYYNTRYFYNLNLDFLNISTADTDILSAQSQIARLRELAIYGLNEVGPNDPNYSLATQAEYHFFEGMSYLFAGMYFSFLPAEPGGVPISSSDHLSRAINSITSAIAINPLASYYMARARAHYLLGDQTNAVADANVVLSINSKLLRAARYDHIGQPSNSMERAVFSSQFRDLQPLISLDFLDPKYAFDGVESPFIYFLKAEEAHLILAEANLASRNLAQAQQNFENLLDLVADASRTVKTLNDSREIRTALDGISDFASVSVNGKTGLVLDRLSNFVNIPAISGTSLTQIEIDNLDFSDNSLSILYRTRQEIFIAEGLRMVDMGVKWVINENEIFQNENINFGDPGTVAVIPLFIQQNRFDIEYYEYIPQNNTYAIFADVNFLLAQNKASNEVLPFH